MCCVVLCVFLFVLCDVSFSSIFCAESMFVFMCFYVFVVCCVFFLLFCVICFSFVLCVVFFFHILCCIALFVPSRVLFCFTFPPLYHSPTVITTITHSNKHNIHNTHDTPCSSIRCLLSRPLPLFLYLSLHSRDWEGEINQ